MRVFTILGPSHAGKTTLATALAAMEGPAGKRQDVAGVAAVQPFTFMDEDWAAIDIAGGTETLAEAGPALAASDAAIVCVPADAGAAVLAAPYLRLVEEAGLPAFLFVNKIDATQDRAADIVASLQAYCRHNVILRQVPIREGGAVTGAVDLISERAWHYEEGKASSLVKLPSAMLAREQEARGELLEALADYDDHLMEELIEDHAPLAAEVYDVAAKVVQHKDLIPAFLGAASHGNGLHRLMKSLRHECPSVEDTSRRLSVRGDAVAVGCLGDQVKHLGKTIVVRALGGPVGTGDPVGGASLGSLTALAGAVPLQPGSLGLAAKSDHLNLGSFYTASGSTPLPGWALPRAPSFRRIVTPQHERDDVRLSAALERLAEIDPALQVEQHPESGHALLNLQGPLHLRRVKEVLKRSFAIDVGEEPVPPALRETITKTVSHNHRHRKQSGGAGQFADVQIDIGPGARGSGFVFSDVVKGGAVPKNYIPSVEAGAAEALAAGPNGHPVVDVAIVLKDGKHHSVDSSDFAFRMAGKLAVKDAMAEAGAVLLQPIMKVQIHVPSDYTGSLVPVVSGMKGQILGFDSHPDAAGWDVFDALLPTAAQDDLCTALASSSRGTGWFTTQFDHYQEAKTEDFAPA